MVIAAQIAQIATSVDLRVDRFGRSSINNAYARDQHRF
jgi:hypothetical protein